jgi:RsmE family RNA methyltransferase
MNLILFEPEEVGRIVPPDDPRSVHIRTIFKRKVGQSFDCGIIDGPRGIATLVSDSPDGIGLRLELGETPPALDPVWLLIGLPRPQTARKILFEATTMGVQKLLFFRAEKSEPSYAQSSLWADGTVRRLLIAGAVQAFCTRLPEVAVLGSLDAALLATASCNSKVALDNYEPTVALSKIPNPKPPTLVAIGPERGWSSEERGHLQKDGFTFAHLGPRVLRAETAAIAAVALIKDRLGLFAAGGGTPSGCNYSG